MRQHINVKKTPGFHNFSELQGKSVLFPKLEIITFFVLTGNSPLTGNYIGLPKPQQKYVLVLGYQHEPKLTTINLSTKPVILAVNKTNTFMVFNRVYRNFDSAVNMAYYTAIQHSEPITTED